MEEEKHDIEEMDQCEVEEEEKIDVKDLNVGCLGIIKLMMPMLILLALLVYIFWCEERSFGELLLEILYLSISICFFCVGFGMLFSLSPEAWRDGNYSCSVLWIVIGVMFFFLSFWTM